MGCVPALVLSGQSLLMIFQGQDKRGQGQGEGAFCPVIPQAWRTEVWT